MSIKKSVELLMKAFDAVQENKDKLPPEYAFLTDPKFAEQLKQIPDMADKVMAAAKALGQEVEVDESKIDELVSYMKEAGLIEEDAEAPVEEGGEEPQVAGEEEELPEEAAKSPMDGEMPVESEDPEKREEEAVATPPGRGPSMAEAGMGAPMGSGDPINDKIKLARKVARVVEYVLSDEE